MSGDSLTRHGEKRLARRAGVGHKGAGRLVELARQRGTPRLETSGNVRRYLDTVFLNSPPATHLVVYAGNVYVFKSEDGPLITMYFLPSKMKHAKAARSPKRPALQEASA